MTRLNFSLMMLFLFIIMIIITTTTVVTGIDPGDDFQGFMEEREKQNQQREKHDSMVHEHEIWRQTTWSGFIVRQLQAVGNHFSPFFLALSDIIEQESDDSLAAFIITLLIRVMVIAAWIIAAYALARIINHVFGQEIVMEEEIIIEEEEDDDDNDDDNNNDNNNNNNNKQDEGKKEK